MDEKAFYRETNVTRPIELNCPHCRTVESYDLAWCVRIKKDQMPSGGDERDRARFEKALSYMVLTDDKVACKNLQCRKRFDVSGIKTMAFLSTEQETELRQQARASGGTRPPSRTRPPRNQRQQKKQRPSGGQPKPRSKDRHPWPHTESHTRDRQQPRRPRSDTNPHRPSY